MSDYYAFIILFDNKEKLCHFQLTQFSVWQRPKCTIFSLDFLKTYGIVLHWNRQLSWQFYVFEWDTQFSFIKIGSFPNDFMFLNKWLHFYAKIGKCPDDFMSWTRYTIFIEWIFCIFLVPYIKKKKQ